MLSTMGVQERHERHSRETTNLIVGYPVTGFTFDN